MTVDLSLAATASTSRPLRAIRLLGSDHPFIDAFANTGVFQSKPFLAAISKSLCTDEHRDLVLIGVTNAAHVPIALFPFVRRRVFGARVIEGLDLAVTDYFAPPINADIGGNDVWLAALSALPPADAIVFRKLPLALHGRPHALSEAPFLKPMGAAAYTARMFNDDGKPILASDLPVARDARRKLRRLEAMGTVTFDEAVSETEVTEALDRLLDFRVTRFEGMGRRDILAGPDYREFYRRLAIAPPRPGRLFSLKVADETIAVIYAMLHGDTITLVIPSMSPATHWQVASPGMVALYKLYEWALAKGLTIFDFSVGSSAYKARFNTEKIELYEYQRALTPLGLLVVLEATLRRTARRFAVDNPRYRLPLERLKEIFG